MRLIDADALKEKKVYSHERHEKIVPVAEIDWSPTIDAIPVEWLNNVMLNCDGEDSKAAWRMLHKWNNDHLPKSAKWRTCKK